MQYRGGEHHTMQTQHDDVSAGSASAGADAQTRPDEAIDRGFRDELLRPHPTGAAAARRPPCVPLAPMKRVQARFNPLADIPVYLVVFLGGCFGTAMRYGLWMWLPYGGTDDVWFMAFHPATFLANMIATFVFALLSSYMANAFWIARRARQLVSRGVGMGMCGGFSTLSAMMVEDVVALRTGGVWSLILYTLLSFLGGLVVAWFGSWLGVRLTARRAGRKAVDDANRLRAPAAKPAIGVRVPLDPRIAAERAMAEAGGARPAASVRVEEPRPVAVADPMQSPSLARLAAADAGAQPDPTTDEIPVVVADPLTGEVE